MQSNSRISPASASDVSAPPHEAGVEATSPAKAQGAGCCSKKTAGAGAAAVQGAAAQAKASPGDFGPSASSPPKAAASPAPARACAADMSTREKKSGCCPSAARPSAPAHATDAYAGLSKRLGGFAALPQYRHPFVEGCTCGSGVIGCCPCTMGLAEQGALTAGGHAGHAGHLPMMLGVGALGLAGLYLGARAITTNREASGRVARARAHNAERMGTLQARAHLLRGSGEAAQARATLADGLVAAQRRQRAFADSWADRRFNLWVPGVVQLVGSVCMVLAGMQHVLGAFPAAPAFGALASGVLAGYAGLYAARVVGRAAQAFADLRAARAAAAAAPNEPFRREAAREAGQVLRQRAWLGLAWTALAGTSAAVWALPALGVAVGAGLGWATAAAQVAAVGTSLAWPAPVHTPSSPRLDEAFDTAALASAALRQSWLDAAGNQEALVRSFSARLLGGNGWLGSRRRLAHRLEPWTTPQCGPRAYVAAASAFVDKIEDDGRWPHGTEAAIATYLRYEHSWLVAAHGVQARRLAGLQAEVGDAEKTEPGAASLASYQRAALAATEAEASDCEARLRARKEGVARAMQQWRGWADGPAKLNERGPMAEEARQAAMVETLVALGLLGEVAGAWIERRPDWFYALPSPSRLAFGHVLLRPEHAEAFTAAVAPSLAFSFVRCLFNPNRLVAERAELLAAGARVPVAATGAVQAAGAVVASAGFGGCSSCVA